MPTAKLVSRIFHSDRWRETAMHAHRNGQFTFVRRGLVNLETEAGIWVVPPGRLAWIPPRLRHA
jgi:quercetin dioxygenase-like cupin family protein